MSSPLQGWGWGRVRGAKGAPGLPWESWSGPQFWIQAQSGALCIPMGVASPLSDLCASGAPGASPAAGGGQGEAKGHTCRCQLASSELSVPLAREIWIWDSLHSRGKRVILKTTSHTSSGTFGQGAKVMDPGWESWAPVQLNFDFSTLTGGGGGGRF